MVVDPGSLELLASDVLEVDLVIWVGISFEQSATTEYFKRVQRALAAAQRNIPMAIVNPTEDALFNLQSSIFNTSELDLIQVGSCVH